MVIDNIFEIGDIVFLKTDPDQRQRIVTSILVRDGGTLSYELSCGTDSKWVYGLEISSEKNVLVSTQ